MAREPATARVSCRVDFEVEAPAGAARGTAQASAAHQKADRSRTRRRCVGRMEGPSMRPRGQGSSRRRPIADTKPKLIKRRRHFFRPGSERDPPAPSTASQLAYLHGRLHNPVLGPSPACGSPRPAKGLDGSPSSKTSAVVSSPVDPPPGCRDSLRLQSRPGLWRPGDAFAWAVAVRRGSERLIDCPSAPGGSLGERLLVPSSIDGPGASATSATGINLRGQVVGDFSAGATGGRRSTGPTGLPPGSSFPEPSKPMRGGINDNGAIVGGFVDADGAEHGFLLAGGTLRKIDAPGAVVTRRLRHQRAGRDRRQFHRR